MPGFLKKRSIGIFVFLTTLNLINLMIALHLIFALNSLFDQSILSSAIWQTGSLFFQTFLFMSVIYHLTG